MDVVFADTTTGGEAPVWTQHFFWLLGRSEILVAIFGFAILGLIFLSTKICKDLVSRLYAAAGLILMGFAAFTGFALGSQAPNSAIHDTYYLFVHTEVAVGYVSVLAIFLVSYALLSRWYSRRLGIVQFVLSAVGIGLIFVPQYFLSLKNMPSRYTGYSDTLVLLEQLGAFGAVLLLASFGLFAFVVGHALWTRAKTKPDRNT